MPESNESQPNTENKPDRRFEKGAGPTENPIATFNLGLETQPNPNVPSDHRTELPLTADFNRDHFHPDQAKVKAARAQVEAATPELGPIQPIPTAEDLADQLEKNSTLQDELATREILRVPRSRQKVAVIKANWREDTKTDQAGLPTVVITPAFLADPTIEGPAHETVKQLALRMPNHRIIAFEQPELTRRQRRALDKNQDLTPTADALLSVLEAQGVENMVLEARSMGAWTAGVMAARSKENGRNITVDKCVFIEPANAEETNVITGLGAGFGHEIAKKYPDLYHAHPKDPGMAKAARLDKSPIRKFLYDAWTAVKPLVTGRAIDTTVRYPQGMAAGTLEADLRAAKAKNPGLQVTLINGNVDPISTSEANNTVADNLNTTFNPNNQPGQNMVSRVTFPGAPHSNLENAKQAADLIAQALTVNLAKEAPDVEKMESITTQVESLK